VLQIACQVYDEDGINEIDSAWVEIEAYNFSQPLINGQENNIYQIELLDYQLPVSSLHLLQGEAIDVYCSDINANIAMPLCGYITRIIDVVPRLVQPTNLETISSLPIEFQWHPEFLPYPFSFRIEIYQVNFGLYTKIFQQSNIPPDDITFTFNNELPTGDYFWLLYIVDSIGNSSSSKEGTFRIE
jgi:hypothetical protein